MRGGGFNIIYGEHVLFEGVCCNCRHPDPRRVWKGGSGLHFTTSIRWIRQIRWIRGRVPNHGFVYAKRYFCLWQPSPAASGRPRRPGRSIITYFDEIITYVDEIITYFDEIITYVDEIITYFDEIITYFDEIITWTSCLFTPLAI